MKAKEGKNFYPSSQKFQFHACHRPQGFIKIWRSDDRRYWSKIFSASESFKKSNDVFATSPYSQFVFSTLLKMKNQALITHSPILKIYVLFDYHPHYKYSVFKSNLVCALAQAQPGGGLGVQSPPPNRERKAKKCLKNARKCIKFPKFFACGAYRHRRRHSFLIIFQFLRKKHKIYHFSP